MTCRHEIDGWTVQPFGLLWVVLCADCGANVTDTAERRLGLTPAHDTLDMAREHVALVQYERGGE